MSVMKMVSNAMWHVMRVCLCGMAHWRLRCGLLFLALGLVLPVVPVQAEYSDVVLNRRAEKEGMRPVVFPHWFHRLRFTCNVCHPDIFKMRAGSNDVTMADIVDGRFCGKCHNGEIAWSVDNCHRCHSGLPGLIGGFYNSQEPTGGPSFLGGKDGRRQ